MTVPATPPVADAGGEHGGVERRTAAEARGRRSAWPALAGCLLGVFMQMLDTTIVNIALPDVATDLAASTAQQVLVLSVYTLAFACTLLPAATLGDRLGRRRLFLAAVIAFVITSTLCGIASNPVELIVFRGAQGISAALMSAQTLALIAALFPRHRHGLVFGIYGAVAGVAAMLGPVLGGLLTTSDILGWGWRTIFFVNIPIGVAAFVLAGRRLPALRSTNVARVDLVGVVTSSAGLFLLLYPLAVGREQGWPVSVWLMLGGAAVLLVVFVISQRRTAARGGAALVPPQLFAARPFAVGVVLSVMFFSVFAGFFFTVSVSMQFGLGFSALRTGLLALPFAVGGAVGSVTSPLVVTRLGGARTLALGAVVLAAGLAWLALAVQPDAAALSVAAVIAPLVVGGLGTGMFVAPLQTVILSGTTETTVGPASGCVPTVQQIGASIGLAVVTVFFFGQVAGHAGTAVPAARAELVSNLRESPVNPAVQSTVADRFADCASRQLGSAHPDRPAPGCGGDSAGGNAMVETILAQAEPDLRAAGRSAVARSFLGALQITLGALAAMSLLIAAGSLLVPGSPLRRLRAGASTD
ncbi:hypothetical protein GCM10009624_08790 [Gordonia sinesedis]